jgi:BirA family biotin operon repressor/biotin-[acetyl-CoA-carboxylase] ligase
VTRVGSVHEPPPAIEAAIADLRRRRPELAFDVRWFPTVSSTMDVVAAAADEGAPSGFVAVAGEQTSGRGRRGHAWSSPAGAGLYVSYLARPSRDAALVTLTAGVAVREAVLAATGLAADLKWPNDLIVGGRKLAGILAEGFGVGGPRAAVVIGVGLNLRMGAHDPDLATRVASVETEINRPVDRGVLLAAVLESLGDRLAALEGGGAGAILRAWSAASPASSGSVVEWTSPAGVVRGTTAGIDDAGALLVRHAGGLERISSGEVRWVRSLRAPEPGA